MASVVYLLHSQFIPEDRLVELMADLFGVRLAAAAIARMSASCVGRFQGFVDALCRCVKAATVKHMDESGIRLGAKTPWLHVAVTAWLSFYRLSPDAGQSVGRHSRDCDSCPLEPYYTLKGVFHALYNAHHLRELQLQALIEIDKEPWALRMQRLLRRACHAAQLARQRDGPTIDLNWML